MKYQDALTEIHQLWGCANIVVTGPQRSGTTIVAHALAHDLNLTYFDEDDIGWEGATQNNHTALYQLLATNSGYVIQAPACAHICHTFPQDTVVVFVRRDIEDIIASQERIGWQYEHIELEKYPVEYRAQTIAHTKYLFWESVQRTQIGYAYEIEYESLCGHPLWADSRKDFAPRQWIVERRIA